MNIDIAKLGLVKDRMNDSIDELSHKGSDGKTRRALVLRNEVVDAYRQKTEGLKIALFYTALIGSGVPPHVCMTVVAVGAVPDLAAGIDFEKWLEERSGWNEEDKSGTRELLRSLDGVDAPTGAPQAPDRTLN